jgi:hypothetical protein
MTDSDDERMNELSDVDQSVTEKSSLTLIPRITKQNIGPA